MCVTQTQHSLLQKQQVRRTLVILPKQNIGTNVSKSLASDDGNVPCNLVKEENNSYEYKSCY